MSDIFSSDALASQVRKVADQAPPETGEAHVAVVAQNGEVGVEGSIEKTLGKGIFVEGDGSWFTRTGYRVAAVLGWKQKPKA
jgi:hypothetical protein